MIQRKYLIFVAGLLVIAAAWTAGWFWLAQKVEADIAEFAARGGAETVELAWDSVSISGFPVRLNARLEKPRGVWSEDGRKIAWTGANAVIGFFSEGRDTVSFEAPGTHEFNIRHAGARFNVDTQSDDLRGRVDFGGDGRMHGLRGLATGVAIRINDTGSAAIGSIAFDWSQADGTPTPASVHPEDVGQTVAFVLSEIDIADSNLDPNVSRILGSRIARFAGDLSLRGAIEPGDINPVTLSRWRDAGGTLELENVDVSWGPLRLAGEGTLALDQALQPVGAFTARVTGLDRLIDVLEQTGEMRPQQAAIARIALAVLTRAPAGGGPPEARVPVAIQNSVVSIGPVSLLKLAPIAWN
ncbi:MAG: hypothetical protein CL566_02815 [Alphaproteobacteria bacterium]|nr:hypothetical protein [Alphaproteobacteria bacterium]